MTEFAQVYILLGLLIALGADVFDKKQSIWFMGLKSAAVCYALITLFWPLLILSAIRDHMKGR